MLSLSMVRAKCYLILQGLERSLADNLVHNYAVDEPGFLTTEERDRALNRLRDDMGESEWGFEDVKTEDLLVYLDLGDLLNLLNRHKSTVRNGTVSDVQGVTRIIHDQALLSIRKRVMHPIRPLEADDLSTLMSIATHLRTDTPNLIWTPLIEGVRLAQSPQDLLDVTIPPFWAEEPTILHNMPPAEFDDTGFIGRRSERRQLRTLLESDHNVITVVGAGGIGKTALALRVCHDILDDPGSSLERIVWVSLKTQYLTTDGIRSVINAVDTAETLVDRLLSAISVPVVIDGQPTWDRVLEQMKANRVLLVIDNLETLGSEIRELAINVPRDSKLLLTSRVGLGEIELRYEMPDLSPRDAGLLLRNLGVAYNYMAISKADGRLLNQYCQRLHYNPLLIKWFVQAVGRGTRPEDVLSKEQDIGRALRFCWENVYDQLSPLSIMIISTLLAARRSLSQAQLQELLPTSHIPFVEALQELHQSNIVERSVDRGGSAVYQVGTLVFDYLSRYHPPDDRIVKSTRLKLRQWQSEQDRSAVQQNTYRYGRNVIVIDSNDERIAAPHLRNALNLMRAHGLSTAHKSLERAQELTPKWWEVHRVRAHVLEMERRPIYEIEQAFEDSLSCKVTDVNRFHYAVYLMRIEEYERALEQIEQAAAHHEADDVALRSVKGLILLRNGRISEAQKELEYVWNYEDAAIPRNIKRVHGTQFADALRRRVEQLYALGNVSEAETMALKGVEVVDRTASACGWDSKLVEEGLKLLSEIMGRSGTSHPFDESFVKKASAWDSDDKFREECMNRRKVQLALESNGRLRSAMPQTCEVVTSRESARLYTGTIDRLFESFGFIRTDSLGDVHMNRSSLLRPSIWRDLRVGQSVVFAVRHDDKGPHALELEPDSEHERR